MLITDEIREVKFVGFPFAQFYCTFIFRKNEINLCETKNEEVKYDPYFQCK